MFSISEHGGGRAGVGSGANQPGVGKYTHSGKPSYQVRSRSKNEGTVVDIQYFDQLKNDSLVQDVAAVSADLELGQT
eukprot:scaffold21966_cov36-Cyclotella_meneghiniana.AAC.7